MLFSHYMRQAFLSLAFLLLALRSEDKFAGKEAATARQLTISQDMSTQDTEPLAVASGC
jgi:hypothetical protein